MRTAVLALFAAAASADAASDALHQVECDGYLWGLMLLDWVCEPEAENNMNWSCIMMDDNEPDELVSCSVDSSSAPWKSVCHLDSGELISPN